MIKNKNNSKAIKIIAEIGINHNGEYLDAKKLIAAAIKSGVSGIKFQYRNLKNAYKKNKNNEIGDEIIKEEIKRNYLLPDEIIKLCEYAHESNVEVGISFFNVEDINDFESKVDIFNFFKVPSVELTNHELIKKLGGHGKPVYISLGCHYESEIENMYRALGDGTWIPMHCISNYPVAMQNAKLGYIEYLKTKWVGKIGYSSHDYNWEMCLIAIAMGVSVVERHITFDKNAKGLDHSTSSTPDEFKKLVDFADSYSFIASGNFPRTPNQGELLNLQNLGRSYYAKVDIDVEEEITLDKLEFRSPRVGLGRQEITEFINKKSIIKIDAGSVINRTVFENKLKLELSSIEYAKNNKISLPVRLHDITSIKRHFQLNSYEFHLSFGEVNNSLVEFDLMNLDKNDSYSIHIPDYINSNQLMDPFSKVEEQAKKSKDMIEKINLFATKLQSYTGKSVPVVGSFSVLNTNKDDFYYKHKELLDKHSRNNVQILMQWLPPIAWYFGGSIKLNILNDLDDALFIEKYEIPICMDVCHLCMGNSLFNFDTISLLKKLKSNIKHMHIADSIGVDGEGIQFGKGDRKNHNTIEYALNFNCLKVIEVWQGHLDNGAGFINALNNLELIYNV